MRRIGIEVDVSDEAPTNQMMDRIMDGRGAHPAANPRLPSIRSNHEPGLNMGTALV